MAKSINAASLLPYMAKHLRGNFHGFSLNRECFPMNYGIVDCSAATIYRYSDIYRDMKVYHDMIYLSISWQL